MKIEWNLDRMSDNEDVNQSHVVVVVCPCCLRFDCEAFSS